MSESGLLRPQVRRPPVGGGSHMDEDERVPAAHADQQAALEGTEGFKVTTSNNNLFCLHSLPYKTHTSLNVCGQ